MSSPCGSGGSRDALEGPRLDDAKSIAPAGAPTQAAFAQVLRQRFGVDVALSQPRMTREV
ncbi:MAG: hypothetical protein GXC76_13575 [Rhodanobacteraceae bacterium]|jgi:hypothetical protein|nr:hypothetical protein [Rhodanobacteraceae bacterium]